LSVNSRTDPPFSMIEFNQLDSPREACAVCYLDMTAEPDRWHEAVRLAVKEVRRYALCTNYQHMYVCYMKCALLV
jgi:hypothetical protein